MNLGVVITLILGLVFQLDQIVPSEVPAAPCAMQAGACECCAGGSQCACASNDESERPQPLPAPAEKQGELKAPVMNRAETSQEVVVTGAVGSPVASVPGLPRNLMAGYRGIRLSVAFCSFVI